MKKKIAAFIRKSKLLSDIWALLLLALGIFLLMYPDTAIKAICQLIGIGMLLYGLVLISSFLIVGSRLAYGNPNIFRVIFGVLLLVMGLFVSIRPNTIVDFAGILFAVLLFAWSINQFLEMKNLVEFRDPRWWLALLSGMVTIIIACIVMFAPIESTALLMRVAGIGLIYTAVSGLFFNMRVVHYGLKFERTYGPLIEDVTGKRVDIGPPKDIPPVIDGEIREVEEEEKKAAADNGSSGKKSKKGFWHRNKKEASEETGADAGEQDGSSDESGNGSDESGNGSDESGSGSGELGSIFDGLDGSSFEADSSSDETGSSAGDPEDSSAGDADASAGFGHEEADPMSADDDLQKD